MRNLLTNKGFSLISFLVLLIVIAYVVITAARVFPSVTEYFEIKKCVVRALREGTDPTEIHDMYYKQARVDYIDSVKEGDLQVEHTDDGKFKASFAYIKEFPMGGPVYLTIKYHGEVTS